LIRAWQCEHRAQNQSTFYQHSIETEFEEKLKQLQEKHQQELAEGGNDDDEAVGTADASDFVEPPREPEALIDNDEADRLRKQEKARRKREAKKEKERQRQEDMEKEDAEAGPSMRRVELDALGIQLKPLSLKISEIPSDGNCLYRAVAAQCEGSNYVKIRNICADALISKQDDYAPFCEYTDTIASFDQYVERVRSSSEWGGHLELRALSEGLKRTLVVYSAAQPKLVMGDEDAENPILLSYHLHYYSLGEHYNQVVPSGSAGEE